MNEQNNNYQDEHIEELGQVLCSTCRFQGKCHILKLFYDKLSTHKEEFYNLETEVFKLGANLDVEIVFNIDFCEKYQKDFSNN